MQAIRKALGIGPIPVWLLMWEECFGFSLLYELLFFSLFGWWRKNWVGLTISERDSLEIRDEDEGFYTVMGWF